jgi:cobalt-zinc-cadmium resistance protein CzcA
VPEVTEVIARTGSTSWGSTRWALARPTVLRLKPRSEWRKGDKAWLVDQIRRRFRPARHPDQLYPAHRNARFRNADRRAAIWSSRSSGRTTRTGAHRGADPDALKALPGTSEALTMANDRVDYLQLDIDRLAAGRVGMPIDQLQDAMRAQVEGMRAGVVADGLRRVPILIRAAPEGRRPRPFADQTYRSPTGQLVRRQRCGAGGTGGGAGQARA